MFTDKHGDIRVGSIVMFCVFFMIILIVACMMGCPVYNVWAEGKQGEAELARAEANRQILIKEAEADREAARYNAEAEVLRAQGVSDAMAIEGEALKSNPAYLQWMFIRNMPNMENVIYIPIDAFLPVIEQRR